MEYVPDLARIFDDFGYTKAQVARTLGVSASIVTLWLRHERRPSWENVQKFEQRMNIPRGLVRPDQWECPPQYRHYLVPARTTQQIAA